MKPKSPISSRHLLRRGFSLTELLVVIVIIIVLAAVVFPMARNMRASANKTECMNRLRGWGVAMAGYATDHDGKVEWKDWPSISWDPAGCSPYVHYWTGGSVDFENRNDNGAYANQLKMRWCPTVAWNPKLGNSPVCYATIRADGQHRRGQHHGILALADQESRPFHAHDRSGIRQRLLHRQFQ